jgi:hypothetical protein
MCEKMEALTASSGSLQPVAEDVDEEIGGARTAGNDGDLARVVEGETYAVRLCLIASSPVDGRRTHRSDAAGINSEISRVDSIHDRNVGEDRSCICGNEIRVRDCVGADVALCGDGKQPNAARGNCAR